MKLLIISNNPLSLSNSNGRTLLNMLKMFKKDDILNIYINGDNPSFNDAFYYQISDGMVLKRKKPFGCYVEKSDNISSPSKKNRKKTVLKYIIRSFVWQKRSISEEITNVATNFKPDRILIQCGDSDFLINIACSLSDKMQVPLISYNTEDYIFKSWNYIEKKNHQSKIFQYFMKRLKKAYDLLYNTAVKFIYLTESLKDLYLQKYPNHDAFVIYNSSDLTPLRSINEYGDFVYCGNVGVGRLESLIEMSSKIYLEFHKKIKVYSQINDLLLLSKINECSFIEYMGNISYDECIVVQKKASFLILVESFCEYYLKDTKNAFSTKIADSLSLGVPLLALVPESSFVYKYLNKNMCAILDSTVDGLVKKLQFLDKDKKRAICSNAINLAKKNHNSIKNSTAFFKILSGAK